MLGKKVNNDGEIVNDDSVDTNAVSLLGDAFGGLQQVDTERDAGAVQRSITKRALEAKSIDELFNVWEPASSDQLVGKVFVIRDYEPESYLTADRGTIPAARVIAYNETEKRDHDFFTTAENLVAFVVSAKSLGALPVTVKIASAKTRAGYDSLHFERA